MKIIKVVDKILKTNILPKIEALNPKMGLSKQAPGIIYLFSNMYCPRKDGLLKIKLKHIKFLQGN
jgi:hypothetical protein